MNSDIYAVVVIYKKACEESAACLSLDGADAVKLLVDNGEQNPANADWCAEHGFSYISMGKNAGLSAAYNAALSWLSGKSGCVAWFDDDTTVSKGYFDALRRALNDDPAAGLFLPLVYSRGSLISPGRFGLRIRRIKDADSIKSVRRLTAINSGLAVRLPVYDGRRYDENIFLDYVDHDFICGCRDDGIGLHVMYDAVLDQCFFADECSSRAIKKQRLAIFQKDYRVFASKHGVPGIIVLLQLFVRRLKCVL